MSVYITARTTVTNKAKYENEFMPAMRPIYEAHGARIIAAGYIDYLTGGPAEKGARVSIIECPDEAHARALFEAAKPVMESISCMSNPRISIVPGIPVAAAAAAE